MIEAAVNWINILDAEIDASRFILNLQTVFSGPELRDALLNFSTDLLYSNTDDPVETKEIMAAFIIFSIFNYILVTTEPSTLRPTIAITNRIQRTEMTNGTVKEKVKKHKYAFSW